MNETSVRISGCWMYLFRPVDNGGADGRLLFLGNARPRSRQMLVEASLVQF